jgi:hypothetical protein
MPKLCCTNIQIYLKLHALEIPLRNHSETYDIALGAELDCETLRILSTLVPL